MNLPAEARCHLSATIVLGVLPALLSLFALPILVHPWKHLGCELRSSWAAGISDYDVAGLLTWRFASFKAGYRWVHSPHESLDGPYIGFSVRL